MGKQLKLGLHTYTLYLWGLGRNWGVQADPRPKLINLNQLMDLAVEWGLDGLHISGCDLETKDDRRLAEVRETAENRGLYLEYNFSRDEGFDPRLTDTVRDGVQIALKLGADLATLGLGIKRPRPVYGSCFHPGVMRQLCDAYDEILAVLPLLEETGIRLAVENHTETFSDEVSWLIRQVNHPLVGACLDTANATGVLENPETAIEKLAPQAFCVHLCDHKLSREPFGFRLHGVALGDGDMDCPKVLEVIRRQSPTDRITCEIEWDMGSDSLETAREKQMNACIRSIEYAQTLLQIGKKEAEEGDLAAG